MPQLAAFRGAQPALADASAAGGTIRVAFVSALRAGHCAQRVVEAFLHYDAAFRAVTRRAPARFARRDWIGGQGDAVERIGLYDLHVQRIIAELEEQFGADAREQSFWCDVKRHFANLIEGLPDNEFCKTFFSSITRRIFRTVGVAPQIEFVATDLDPLASAGSLVPQSTHGYDGSLPRLVAQLLHSLPLPATWEDIDSAITQVSVVLATRLRIDAPAARVERIEVIDAVFYQSTGAYVVGRIVGPDYQMPLALALQNTERGIRVDHVMLTEAELSTLFGFSHSYFHADLERVADAVSYLKALMPQTPVGELFTVLGRAKQGKTERHRSLMRHLDASTDLFHLAPGQRGLVMVCFTLPSLDVVFKVIRDRIPIQKDLSRDDVIAKYNFVFKHDRAGRLVDAQEFRRLRIPRTRFADDVIQELLTEADSTVHLDDDNVVLDHVYAERRVTPLDIYLRCASLNDATHAAIDYGDAIRDLARSNIFAGDLLFKNFGVTQHGRVIFYDYDEVVPLTQCHFRELPVASHYEDELSANPWFFVGQADVFPETFIRFLPFSELQLSAFLAIHGEILKAQFWQRLQHELRNGAILEVMPYARRPSVEAAASLALTAQATAASGDSLSA